MSIFTARGQSLLLLFSVFCACATSAADTGSESLTLDQALALTIERNPELAAFGYQIDAQQGRVQQSGLGPAPEVGILVENALGSGEFSGLDRSETTLSLSWALERGKADRRVNASRAGMSMLEAHGEIKRIDAAAETARRFLDCLDDQERLVQLDAAVMLSEQTVDALEKRVAAGRTPEAELARAQARLAQLQLDQEDMEHRLRVSVRRLAAQWGETQPKFSRVLGDVRALPTLGDFESLMKRVDNNPSVAKLLTEKRLREAELRLVEAEAKPNWYVNTGARWFEESSDYALIAGIKIPISSKARNRARISEARANLARAETDGTATRIEIETQLYALYEELNHSLHRGDVLREDILPRVEQALVDAERAYAAGRYGYFELSVVQAEVLNSRTAVIDASIDAHRNVIEIERLTGVTVSSLPLDSEEDQ